MRRVVRYKAIGGVQMILAALLFVAPAAHTCHAVQIAEAPTAVAPAPAAWHEADLPSDDDDIDDDDAVIHAEPKRSSSPLATVSPAGVVQALPVDSHSASGGIAPCPFPSPSSLFLTSLKSKSIVIGCDSRAGFKS